MFIKSDLVRVIDLQQRAFALLQWINRSLLAGSLGFEQVHEAMSLAEAAEEWIGRHFDSLPENARPPREQLTPFARLFASFLTTSYEVAPNRTVKALGCRCGFCYLVLSARNFKPRRPSKRAAAEAAELEQLALRNLAAEIGVTLAPGDLDRLLQSADQPGVARAWVTYGQELIRRSQYRSQGEGILVLWRRIAWDEHGTPRKKFRLTPEAILAAEEEVKGWLALTLT